MNEIVIGNSGISIGADEALVRIKAVPYSFRLTPSEALQLADAIYKVRGEPTREECFEAGRTIQGCGMNTTFTDYINEYKNQNNGK